MPAMGSQAAAALAGPRWLLAIPDAICQLEELDRDLLTRRDLEHRFGVADVARGLALRMDHGSQYLSDHFLNQLRYWGIHPSFGFVEEPETNGVVERWNRTLKEQAVYGRVFRNLAEVRSAVAEFRRTLQPVLAPREAGVPHAT